MGLLVARHSPLRGGKFEHFLGGGFRAKGGEKRKKRPTGKPAGSGNQANKVEEQKKVEQRESRDGGPRGKRRS